MQDQFKSKKWIFYAVLLATLVIVATPVLADYLGPDRTVTQTVSTCQVVLYECRFVAAKNAYRYRRVEDWSCSNESKPWQGYPSDGQGCSENTVGDQYWSHKETMKETIVTHPPATIGGSLQNCTLQNGWCGVTAPELFLSANEPLSGYSILLIEGTLNGQTFACPGGTTNCRIPLLQGNNSFAYWALSSWGDSSEMGMSNVKVDTVSPDLSLDIIGASGTNGWYVSSTTVTAVGFDATSGLSNAQLSVDGGAWQPSVTLNEGVYDLAAAAADNAGNISNASTVVSVDTTTPAIDVTVNGTAGLNGWYLSSIQVSAVASDATSGVGTLEVSADGGVYQSYTAPVYFSDGHHTIRFKAVDHAGNTTETPVQEFYVDTIPPTIHLPGSWLIGRNVPYDVQDDGSGLASLRLVIEDEDERYAKVAWNEHVSGGTYSQDFNWNGEFRDKTIAPPGTYLTWIKAADRAGNESIKLGKVIIPEPNVFLNLIPTEASSVEETPAPPEDLYDGESLSPEATSPASEALPLPGTSFGGSTAETTEPTIQSRFLTSGSSATIPSTSSSVLWGSAAAAVIGSATAYALSERRKREETEAKQAAQVAKQLDHDAKKRAGKKQKQQANWAQQQALEQARLQEEREQQLLSNARMEAKMDRLDAEDDAKWTASQAVVQKRAEEEKKKLEKQYTGLASYRDSEWHSEPIVVAASKEKSWWEKGLDWVDNHQTEIALGIGVAVGVGAIILSGGLATPLVAAAWVAGSAVVAAGTVAAGTVALNVHYGREWNDNLLKNMAVAGVAAAAVSGAWFIFQTATTGIGAYCAVNQTTCARVEPVLNLVDTGEEAWLSTKLAYQTYTGNTAGALETALEIQSEHLDGGMPGNSIAKELGGETLEAVTKYGDEAVELVTLYGADAAEIIFSYGDDGIAVLQRYGKDGIKLIKDHGGLAIRVMEAVDLEAAQKLLKTVGDNDLYSAIKAGPDAMKALTAWDESDLLKHGAELAARAKKDAEVLVKVKKLVSLGPINPEKLTDEQRDLIKFIAENSTFYADEGQIVLGKWANFSGGFLEYARETNSIHYGPHPDMYNLLEDLDNQDKVAWLVNQSVIQTGVGKGKPFEYSLNGIKPENIELEEDAINKIWEGAPDIETMYANIKEALEIDYVPVRMMELVELYNAGYVYSYDTVTNSYILIKP